MNALLNVFARLCVFRRGPEDMPYAPPLVGILLALWMVIQLLSAALQDGLSVAQMVGVQLLAMGLLLGSSALVLAFKNLLGRWTQTAIALIGVDIALSLLALPMLLIGHAAGGTPSILEGVSLLLVSGQLGVQAFIFHCAFAIGPLPGVAVAFGLLILTFMLVGALMPEVLQASQAA